MNRDDVACNPQEQIPEYGNFSEDERYQRFSYARQSQSGLKNRFRKEGEAAAIKIQMLIPVFNGVVVSCIASLRRLTTTNIVPMYDLCTKT